MKQTWRWFGPDDEISINEICQAGAQGVVSALHHIPTGDAWHVTDIEQRQKEIATFNGKPSGLAWDVVESVPVSEAIKTQTGAYKDHFEAYRTSLINLAECGLETICYNFMPVLDWTRTQLDRRLPHGGTAMSFDLIDFAVFDCFILKRAGANEDYSESLYASAEQRFAQMDSASVQQLSNNIVAGLPGANDNWSLDDVRAHLQSYAAVSADKLRANLIDFLSEVIPTAEKLGIRMCAHPDDPPFSLLGLPRVMSSQADYESVLTAVDSHANGATFCTGSLGITADFDPVGFIEKLGPRIHFVHLRNTTRHEPKDGSRVSFFEAEHLEGDTNMAATIHALLNEEARRREENRVDHQIPMRPDHGQALLADLERPMNPGYPLIGRLRGLAEIRGVMAGYEAMR